MLSQIDTEPIVSLCERLKNIKPQYPFLLRFMEEESLLIRSTIESLSTREVVLSLLPDGGRGSPLMCDALAYQLKVVLPMVRLLKRGDSDWGKKLSVFIDAYETDIKVSDNLITIPLESARMLFPPVYSEEQISRIDNDLGFTGKCILGLTSVSAEEVSGEHIKILLDQGTFDRVVIFPHSMEDVEDIVETLLRNDITPSIMSKGWGAKQTQAYIVDYYGLISTILQSRSINTTIVGEGHNPTESLFSGCNTFMLPESSYVKTIAAAGKYSSLQLVSSNSEAWRRITSVKPGQKDYRFRNDFLSENYDKYFSFMKMLISLL